MSMNNGDLGPGKTVWIAGGAGHLGAPIVAALDARGVKTLCLDLPGRAESLVRERQLKHTIPVVLDFTDLAAIKAVTTELIREHGVPEGVALLTFASSGGKTLEQLTAEDFSRTLTLALTPSFEFCRTMAGAMAERGHGSIVLFSSMYGLVSPDPKIYRAPMTTNPIDYGTSKAGLVQMMKYFAVHYGRRGVRFNCVAPGPFPNPAVQRDHPDFIGRLGEKTALGRIGQATEIAGPTLFLLSEASSFVTGHCLTVDGGWTTW
jgi:NAD(P)-dependent dehydrogenase (short-subunit alcohol dehydrogenase family)